MRRNLREVETEPEYSDISRKKRFSRRKRSALINAVKGDIKCKQTNQKKEL